MISHLGPILVAVVAVEQTDRSGRRHAERQAVARCFDELRATDPEIPDYESLTHDVHGAPLLPGWQISITHSRAVAAVAICRAGQSPAFGIDAEEWRPALLKVTSKYLSSTERARVIPDDKELSASTQEILLRLWTIKEAVYKAAATPTLPFPAIQTNPQLTRATTPASAFTLHPIPHPASTITVAITETQI